MVMVFFSPLRRWWQTAFGVRGDLSFVSVNLPFDPRQAVAPWRSMRRASSVVRPSVRKPVPQAPRPLTAFRAVAAPAAPSRQVARRFWMTLDPHDRRHAAIGGSFAEVCAALEQLAAVEERCA